MIRDRLVVGIRNNALSERLQMNAGLNLEKAMQMIRQSEAVHEQQILLHGNDRNIEPGNLDSFRFNKQQSSRYPSKSIRPSDGNLCGRCGRGTHGHDKCPAREAICSRCHKRGHYSLQCHTKMVHSTSSETSMDTAFLDVMIGDQTKFILDSRNQLEQSSYTLQVRHWS